MRLEENYFKSLNSRMISHVHELSGEGEGLRHTIANCLNCNDITFQAGLEVFV